MKLHAARRLATAAVVGSVAFVGLMAAPSAHAATTDGYVRATGSFDDGADCATSTPVTALDPAPVTDNGIPVRQTFATSGTVTSPDNAADVTDLSTSSAVTAKVTPIAGGPARIDVTATAAAHAVPRLGAATTSCDAEADASARTSFGFALTAPMWATVSAATSGDARGYGSVEIEGENAGAVQVGSAGKASGSTTALLPAGKYYFSARSSAYAYPSTTVAAAQHATVTGTFAVTLTPVGSAGAVVGKGGRFVSFGARSCASNSVSASLGRVVKKKATKVQVSVNGTKRATFAKKQLKGRTVVLGGIAPTAPATVSAVITLKNGKKVTVSRSYLACS